MRLGLLGRQPHAVDGVRRQAHRGRQRLRPGEQPGRRARRRSPPDARRQVGRAERQQRHDHGEPRLRQPVLGDAAHELRPDAEADREQEDQEEDRLHVGRDRDVELADDDGRDQRGGDGAEAEAAPGLAADLVADGERDEDGDLRMGTQRRRDPVSRDHLPCREGRPAGAGGLCFGQACSSSARGGTARDTACRAPASAPDGAAPQHRVVGEGRSPRPGRLRRRRRGCFSRWSMDRASRPPAACPPCRG